MNTSKLITLLALGCAAVASAPAQTAVRIAPGTTRDAAISRVHRADPSHLGRVEAARIKAARIKAARLKALRIQNARADAAGEERPARLVRPSRVSPVRSGR